MGNNSYGFAYDAIGKRITYTETAVTTRYKANELNQCMTLLYISPTRTWQGWDWYKCQSQ